MNRKDLQELAALRAKEAAALLKAGFSDGAYYLAGYAVECAIKACIARKTERFDFPNKRRADDSWKHDLDGLIKTAGLDKVLQADQLAQPLLNENWSTVRQWSVESRYQRHTAAEASDLFKAVNDRKYGVLAWLKHHW